MPLPLPPTPLIAREAEIATAEARLLDGGTRLLTLIGPPGVGKTRLSLALAQRRVEHDPEGVVFVALENVADADAVPEAIARALGLRESPGQTLVAALHAALRGRHALLLLDNFEHLVAAGRAVDNLLTACPDVQALVTSRTALRLRAEILLPVEPLAVPLDAIGDDGDGAAHADLEAIGSAPATQLFLARAQAVRPALTLTADNAPHIAAICARLDGLPLAIELAAARSRLFSPRELAERLRTRLPLLTGGGLDLPPRQRTLRGAIAWSYELLTVEEQRLFRLLSVFTGGGVLDAIAALTQENGGADLSSELLDALDALLGHSLLRRVEDADGTSRFGMLETIREYAGERLEQEGEAESARLRLAGWYLALAQLAGPALSGADQIVWLARLDADQDNLRTVLQWSLDSGRAALALELAGAIWRFWWQRGRLSQGRDWLTRALARAPRAPGPLRARALHGAGMIALEQGDFTGAAALAEQSLTLYREAGEPGAAEALNLLGRLAMRRSQYDAARAYLEESLALARADQNERLVGQCFNVLGVLALDEGRFVDARELHEQALAAAEALGDLRTVAIVQNNLGLITHRLDDFAAARAYAERALALNRRLGNPIEASRTLTLLAMIVRGLDDNDEARAFAEEALALARASGNEMGVVGALSQLTAIARAQGDRAAASRFSAEHLESARRIGYPIQQLSAVTEAALNAHAAGLSARAVRLLAASEAMREAMGLAQHEGMRRMLEDYLSALRDRLGGDAFARAWAEGTALSAEAAITHALAAPNDTVNTDAPAPTAASPRDASDGLTRRQIEILALVAAGKSNAEIAAQLVLSERTIEHHVAHIYSRIGVRGRVEATAYALRHGYIG